MTSADDEWFSPDEKFVYDSAENTDHDVQSEIFDYSTKPISETEATKEKRYKANLKTRGMYLEAMNDADGKKVTPVEQESRKVCRSRRKRFGIEPEQSDTSRTNKAMIIQTETVKKILKETLKEILPSELRAWQLIQNQNSTKSGGIEDVDLRFKSTVDPGSRPTAQSTDMSQRLPQHQSTSTTNVAEMQITNSAWLQAPPDAPNIRIPIPHEPNVEQECGCGAYILKKIFRRR